MADEPGGTASPEAEHTLRGKWWVSGPDHKLPTIDPTSTTCVHRQHGPSNSGSRPQIHASELFLWSGLQLGLLLVGDDFLLQMNFSANQLTLDFKVLQVVE